MNEEAKGKGGVLYEMINFDRRIMKQSVNRIITKTKRRVYDETLIIFHFNCRYA